MKLILFTFTLIASSSENISVQAEPLLTTSCPPVLGGVQHPDCPNTQASAGWEWFMAHCVLSQCNKPPSVGWKSFVASKKNIMGDGVAIKPLLSIQCPPYSWAVNNYNNNTYDLPDPNGNYWRFGTAIPSPLPPVPSADSNWDTIEATYNPNNTADFRCRNSRVPLADDGWFIALRRDTEEDDYFTSCMLTDGNYSLTLKNDGSTVTIHNIRAKLICIKAPPPK